MPQPVTMSCSRTYPLAVDDTFERLLQLPLDVLFDRRHLAIPAVRATDGPADWSTVGQSRVVKLADGGSMREELVRVDPPHAFGYVLSDLTGPMKPLAAKVDGVWSFEPAGTGTRVTWQWTVHPRSVAAAALLPVFARLWQGYARKAMARFEDLALPA